MNHLLVIVSRDEPERCARLAQLFDGQTVDIVLDRRLGERRQSHVRPGAERRRGARRARVRTEVRIPIDRDADVVAARRKGRDLASAVGLSAMESAVIATAVSELARHIVSCAVLGEIVLRVIETKHALGIEVAAIDGGTGIMDITQTLGNGASSARAGGGGLPGIRRLMDAFFITTELGKGTAITIRRWCR